MNDGSNQAGLLFFFVFPNVGYEGCIGLDGSEFMSAQPLSRGVLIIAHELLFLEASTKHFLNDFGSLRVLPMLPAL